MNKKELGFKDFVYLFFARRRYEEFYFIDIEELNDLSAQYQNDIRGVCCGQRAGKKKKYEKILQERFDNYSDVS